MFLDLCESLHFNKFTIQRILTKEKTQGLLEENSIYVLELSSRNLTLNPSQHFWNEFINSLYQYFGFTVRKKGRTFKKKVEDEACRDNSQEDLALPLQLKGLSIRILVLTLMTGLWLLHMINVQSTPNLLFLFCDWGGLSVMSWQNVENVKTFC